MVTKVGPTATMIGAGAKITAYMRMPRTTVIRRLNRLCSWGLVDRVGYRYHMHTKTLNSLLGMRSYQKVRRQRQN